MGALTNCFFSKSGRTTTPNDTFFSNLLNAVQSIFSPCSLLKIACLELLYNDWHISDWEGLVSSLVLEDVMQNPTKSLVPVLNWDNSH